MKYFALIAAAAALFSQTLPAEDVGKPYSVRMMDSEMLRNPDATWLDGRQGKLKWNYTTGLELLSFLDVADRYALPYAEDYVRDWADTMADKNGKVVTYRKENYNVDHICPGRIYYRLYYKTGDRKYRRVLRTLREQLDTQPRTSEGAFWHKQVYPHQVWLDGLYMAQPFYAEYTKKFSPKKDRDSLFSDICNHFDVAAKHTYDPGTGLFRHAWDESKSMFWADSLTGQSAHAWGRACGWYAMALAETMDYLPEKHPGRQELMARFRYIMEKLPEYADPQTGMWYQVLDCPGKPGNYLEATASAMFVYSYLKGVRQGWLSGEWRDYADDLYLKFIKAFVKENPDGTISITSCCSVAGLGGKQMRSGTYGYYLSEPVIDNDCKGVGPFIWASLEYEAMHNIEYAYDGKAVRNGKIVDEPLTLDLAFDGADGGGKYTRGGKGGKVYVVTSLADDGEEGTLRYAVEAEGPRIVEFAVEGDIHLESELKIENPYITISGQTAPGKGITLRDHGMMIRADEVIVRYMRFRMGSAMKDENDALGARQVRNLMIDHCSISWATDENASFYAIADASVQWCIIAEALNSSIHRKGEHGYGGIWGGRNVSFHHNILADNNSRNPRFDHPSIYDGSDRLFYRGTVEFKDNIVFNWGMKAIYGGEEGWFNVMDNVFIPGPATRNLDGQYLQVYTSESTSMIPGSFHISGNVYDVSHVRKGNWNGKTPDYDKISRQEAEYEAISADKPFFMKYPAASEPASEAYRAVLKDAGASLYRDETDERIVRQIKTGKVTVRGSVTGLPGIIDSENDVL